MIFFQVLDVCYFMANLGFFLYDVTYSLINFKKSNIVVNLCRVVVWVITILLLTNIMFEE